MKTVSQLAQELKVNRTTLHRLIQRNNIATLQEGNKRLIDATAEAAILKAFNNKSLQGETLLKRCENNNETLQRNNIATIEELTAKLTDKDKSIDLLQSQIDLLENRLADRDKTIEELKADKEKLNQRLDAAEAKEMKLTETMQELTIALKAAQALHGMEKKTKVIEIAEPERPAANVESRTVSAPRPAQRNRSERQQPTKKDSSFISFIKNKFQRKQ